MTRAFVAFICWIWCSQAGAMVGGAPAAESDIARQIVLIVGSRGSFCTGSTLAPGLVLTAAHCVLPGADYKLVEFDAARQPAFRDVTAIRRHPQFDLQALLGHRATADIALLQLAAPLPGAATAILSDDRRVAVGESFIVIGAGVTARGDGRTGGTARAATLAATGRPGNLQIRLVDPATNGTRAGLGACTGDSGAPVFRNAGRLVLIGIVSWSTGPNGSGGCGGLTGVTPLSLYRGWIVETAKTLGSPLP